MNLDRAITNIDTVLQNTKMTRQEHIELDSNLKFLVARAKLADKLEQEIKAISKDKDLLRTDVPVIVEKGKPNGK